MGEMVVMLQKRILGWGKSVARMQRVLDVESVQVVWWKRLKFKSWRRAGSRKKWYCLRTVSIRRVAEVTGQ